MNIEQIVSTMLNGEPMHDSIVIGLIFVVFMEFYYTLFSAVFSLFKK